MPPTRGPPPTPRYWLEFRLFSDGLDSAAAQALTTRIYGRDAQFHYFPHLPIELRLKIWEYLLTPRILMIACLDGCESVAGQRESFFGSRPSTTKPTPPLLLRISRETRALAQRHYELAFPWKAPPVFTVSQPAPPSTRSSSPSDYSFSSSSSSSSSHAPRPPLQRSTLAPRRKKHSLGDCGWAEPRIFFNYGLDAVFLLGELEAYDSFGNACPMAHFLRMRDTRRVKRVAVAFSALRLGEAGSRSLFGSLFHVVDSFAPVDGRLWVTVTPADEVTYALMSGRGGLVRDDTEEVEDEKEQKGKAKNVVSGDGNNGNNHAADEGIGSSSSSSTTYTSTGTQTNKMKELNVIQTIWRARYGGLMCKSSLARTEFALVPEIDLERRILDSVASEGDERKKKISAAK